MEKRHFNGQSAELCRYVGAILVITVFCQESHVATQRPNVTTMDEPQHIFYSVKIWLIIIDCTSFLSGCSTAKRQKSTASVGCYM